MQDAEGPFRIRVETAPSPGGDAVPQRFFLRSRRVEISEILDQWPGADYIYFKVLGDDGDHYILRHSTAENTWELTAYQRG